MKLSDYSLENPEAAQELLDNPDFIQAFCGALNLLGSLFLYHPATDDNGARALNSLRSLELAGEWPFGSDEQRAQAAQLMEEGKAEDSEALERCFTELFRGPGKLPAAIWGSVYLDHEQVTYGDSWVSLRAWMRSHGIKALYSEKEPEDQIGRMMLLSAQVAAERPDLLVELWGDHFLPWAYRFFDLFTPAAFERSQTYAALAILGRATLEDVQSLLGLTPAKLRLYR